LTNAHVANNSSLRAEFWSDGHKSELIDAKLLQRADREDVAIISVPLSVFNEGRVPQIYPLAFGSKLSPGEEIVSHGCANGGWPTMFRGHVLEDNGSVVKFKPPPAGGRSGSAIFDSSGTKIVGLVYERAQNSDEMWGKAIAPSTIARVLGMTPAVFKTQYNTQCPGGVCPQPSAPQMPKFNRNIMGKQEFVYPQLPPAAPQVQVPDCTERCTNIEKQLLTQKMELDALKAEIENFHGLNDSVAGNAGTVSDIQARIDEVNGDVTLNKETVEAMLAKLEEANKTIAALQGKVDGVPDTSGLEGKITDAVDGKLSDLESGLDATIAGKVDDGLNEIDDKVDEKVSDGIEKAESGWADKIKSAASSALWGIVSMWGWPAGIGLVIAGFFLYRKVDTDKNWRISADEAIAAAQSVGGKAMDAVGAVSDTAGKALETAKMAWDKVRDGNIDYNYKHHDIVNNPYPVDPNHALYPQWRANFPAIAAQQPGYIPPAPPQQPPQ
jgi:hypothetical protein